MKVIINFQDQIVNQTKQINEYSLPCAFCVLHFNGENERKVITTKIQNITEKLTKCSCGTFEHNMFQ